jgi:hypothetical protein
MPTAPIINDRRNKDERRRMGSSTQFPIITTQGVCVRKDRRTIPERRISNIVVKEWKMKDSVFEMLFTDQIPTDQAKK